MLAIPMPSGASLWKRTSIAVAAGLCLCSGVVAQSSDGSLFGRATAGSAVVITNMETGATRQAKAEANGSFTFNKLPPGQYRISSGKEVRVVSVAIG